MQHQFLQCQILLRDLTLGPNPNSEPSLGKNDWGSRVLFVSQHLLSIFLTTALQHPLIESVFPFLSSHFPRQQNELSSPPWLVEHGHMTRFLPSRPKARDFFFFFALQILGRKMSLFSKLGRIYIWTISGNFCLYIPRLWWWKEMKEKTLWRKRET